MASGKEQEWGEPKLYGAEAGLYPHVKNYLDLEFYSLIKPALGSLLWVVEGTAQAAQGPRGTWTRPDLCGVAVWQHKYSATKNVDLYGFEVKRGAACDVTAVHEALAHTRFVHFSYLVCNMDRAATRAAAFQAIEDSCRAHGIGLIIAHDPESVSRYHVKLRGTRKRPDCEVVDQFIEDKFSAPGRELIQSRL